MKGLAQVPVANFSVFPNPACTNATVQIMDASTNAPTAWSYTMASATPSTSTIKNPVITYTAAGTYSITLVSTNGAGSSLPVVKTITVIASPTLFINPNNLQTCLGGSVTFFSFGAGTGAPYTYSWSTGATTSSVMVTPTVTTVYSCVLTATTGCKATNTATATVNFPPSLTVTANPTVICGPSTVTMTAIAAGAAPFTYSWSAGGTASTAVTPAPGTYSVTVTDSKTCKKTGMITITNGTIPTVSVVSSASILCVGQTATLSASGTAITYSWNTGPTTPAITVSPTVTTSYSVTGTSASGCKKVAVITQSVSACLGVNSLNNQDSEFGIYPNPNNGEFTISTKQISDNTYVEIYNGLGQLIKHAALKESTNNINLSKEAFGVYHIRIIQDANPVYRTKILVN